MNKGIFFLNGFLLVILVLIQSKNASCFKVCLGGICMPKEKKIDRVKNPIKQRPNVKNDSIPKSEVLEIKKPYPVIVRPDAAIVVPVIENTNPTRRSSMKKAENNTPPKMRKSSISPNGRQSKEGSPTRRSKSPIRKGEAARSENILANLEVQVASRGKTTRNAKQAEIFKVAVEEKSKAHGLSDTFILTGESCANGMGNLYKKYKYTKF